ncbi:DoxX family protein [Shimia aestuarii]|uniref:Putative oxidoreductase n=1 Tax=Shimia aestuarii TaxID=254406 RepID=A0A1I4QMC4_9RHOB|nr:DoxX family protein [Shimia aestuarii]SFM41169.1 putative oxidoreductase [Shimia aestuarii]
MKTLFALYDGLSGRLDRLDWLLPTVARFLFAAVLAGYFWKSGLTKLGDGFLGVFTPSMGAYAQIFPKAFEAVGYDSSQLGVFHWVVVVSGTLAEFILPALIIIGLLARIAALGMIGFVTVQSLTDLYGHHLINDPKSVGAWFDRFPDGLILDQRGLWMFLFLVILIKGAGPLSLDRILKRGL